MKKFFVMKYNTDDEYLDIQAEQCRSLTRATEKLVRFFNKKSLKKNKAVYKQNWSRSNRQDGVEIVSRKGKK